ncbi:50S ribosomal protein L24 [Candidatus Pseudomonas adelgestsugas]|uniref:Large ribosomal subunit protein uL24 n=1 Tax=Candidatus Pseudomonas adelgestsugas TaxID=1302376 RepID=A0ABX5R8N4_9PSED|nr:50S ribosomal protein L24 [Candidatus Pseudomonas adelgestsugas]QAX81643.1 50S ribosomal protein L24 [Candidatus Pseudomonas adelgestsugas]
MHKIRRDDEIIVIAGKEKGKRGKVLKVFTDNRLVVSGLNLIKRHTKPNQMLGAQGGIVKTEAPLHVSNVAVFNSETNKADRIGFKVKDGKKIRVFKSTQQEVDVLTMLGK